MLDIQLLRTQLDHVAARLATRGLHLSIEFTGGTVLEVQYTQTADIDRTRGIVGRLLQCTLQRADLLAQQLLLVAELVEGGLRLTLGDIGGDELVDARLLQLLPGHRQ